VKRNEDSKGEMKRSEINTRESKEAKVMKGK
jgi:hypothetical protein